jgi:hypothetical protein
MQTGRFFRVKKFLNYRPSWLKVETHQEERKHIRQKKEAINKM